MARMCISAWSTRKAINRTLRCRPAGAIVEARAAVHGGRASPTCLNFAHWSRHLRSLISASDRITGPAGYAAFGVQNREATIRACPRLTRRNRRRPSICELRPPDATASPYMVLARSFTPGLKGSGSKLPLPPILDRDPADYSEAERKALGVRTLPSSLGEALDLMLASKTVSELDAGPAPRILCRRQTQGDRDVRRDGTGGHVQAVSRCLLKASRAFR